MNSVCFGANSIKHFKFLGVKWNDKYHVCLQFHKDVSNYYNKQFLLLSYSPFVTKIQGFRLVKSSHCWLLLDCKNTLAIIPVTTQGHSVSFTPWSLTHGHGNTAWAPERTVRPCDPPSLPTTPSMGLDQWEVNALWVKSGNRGNLKCLKVNDNLALIFCQKRFISF